MLCVKYIYICFGSKASIMYFGIDYNCIIHEDNGKLKPLIMHTLQHIISLVLLGIISQKQIIFSPDHPGTEAFRYLTSLPQPVIGVSAYAFETKNNNSKLVILLGGRVRHWIMSRLFVTWRWEQENANIIATIPGAGILAWISICIICVQFYVAIVPCIQNGFYWDERCFTSWLESFGGTSFAALIILGNPDIGEIWPKRSDGLIGYLGRYINLILTILQSIIIALTGFICILPYIGFVGFCNICSTIFIFCTNETEEPNSRLLIPELDNNVSQQIKYKSSKGDCRSTIELFLGIILYAIMITIMIWAVFAGGKLYTGDMNYIESALCVWHERSWSVYIGYDFSTFRSWITTF